MILAWASPFNLINWLIVNAYLYSKQLLLFGFSQHYKLCNLIISENAVFFKLIESLLDVFFKNFGLIFIFFMTIFQPLEVVDCGRETQPQVVVN